MEFTAWSLFIDIGLVSALLLIGTILRAKVKVIQKLFLPAGIIAGILGLILGPNGFGLIPFSQQIGVYPGILIAVIFGALPLTAQKVPWKEISRRVGGMWSFSQFVMICMWGGGLLFSLLIINTIWKDEVHLGFGLMLAAGFAGGHGTAAAIGDAFAQHGWEDATSLAMTSATVGIVSAIVIGMIFVKRGASKGQTSFLTSFDRLPDELKTGLVPSKNRKAIKMDTVSSISIDPLIFHASIVGLIAMLGYFLSKWGAELLPKVALPAFSLAFIVGLIVKKALDKMQADDYVDKDVINRISGAATDLLVAFGISSISLPVVLEYITPLAILFLFGLLYAWVCCLSLSKRFFSEYWFEKGLFTWGWATGTVAMGIALLRIVDPDLKSKTLDDFGLAYIPMAPVEIAVVTFSPLLIATGQHWLFVAVTLAFGIILIALARMNKWIVPVGTNNKDTNINL